MMVLMVISVAGACQLVNWIFSFVDFIEGRD